MLRIPQPSVFVAVLCGLLAHEVEGTARGDPVQAFKRLRFGDQRTMWSDVLVGQAPLFAVDRAQELHLPTTDAIKSSEAVKLQLSYDREKFTSEWLTLSDGKGLLLDTLTVTFVYSGSDIKEVHHRQQFVKTPDENNPPPHQKSITLAYKWIQDVDTDTRGGLNFLFVSGFCLTMLALVAVLLDSSDLLSVRALLLPEYDDDGKRKPKVKSFVLLQSGDEDGEGRNISAQNSVINSLESQQQGLRARGGGDAREVSRDNDPEGFAADSSPLKAGDKGD